MSNGLSNTAYKTRDEAAVGGFRWVLARGPEWERKEFGFWVILKVSAAKKVEYHYTTPQPGSNLGVTLTLPTGLIVRGFCHTHPKSISTGNFGGDDFDSFKKVAKLKLDIVFYLLNPQREIRYARDVSDFMAGKSLDWLKVTP
jgi:hypothetical protein